MLAPIWGGGFTGTMKRCGEPRKSLRMSMEASLPSPDILLEHAAWVRRLASDLVRDQDAAEDVAQDTWLAFLKQRPSGDRPLRPWLARVVRNKAALRIRRGAGRRAREAEVARKEALPSAEDIVERGEVQRELVDAVLKLDEPYRSVLLLRYYEGLQPIAIARLRGAPPATIRTQLARGQAKLRERLDAAHGGDRSSWGARLAPLLIPVAAGRKKISTMVLAGAAAVGLVAAIAVRSGALSSTAPADSFDRKSLSGAAAAEGLTDELAALPQENAQRQASGKDDVNLGARTVQLIDRDRGAVLAGYAVRVGGENLTSDRNGMLQLPADTKSLVLTDQEGCARSVVNSHGARELIAAEPGSFKVPTSPDVGSPESPAQEPAPEQMRLPAGPELHIEIVANERIDPERFEVLLRVRNRTAYIDDAKPIHIAPLRRTIGDDTAWVRFAPAASALLSSTPEWTVQLRDRAGLRSGLVHLSSLDHAEGNPVTLRLEHTAKLEGAVDAGIVGPTLSAEVILTQPGTDAPRMIANGVVGDDGSFSIAWVPPGAFELVIRSHLHERWTMPITLAPGESRWIDVELIARPSGGTVSGVVRRETNAFDEQLLVILLDENDDAIGIYPTTWTEGEGQANEAAFSFDDAPGGALRLDVVSLSSAVTFTIEPTVLIAPNTSVAVRLRDDVPSHDVAFDVFDPDSGERLLDFDLEAVIGDGPARRFIRRPTKAVPTWTFSAADLRWNDFESEAPIRRLPVNTAFRWTVRAEGYVAASGDQDSVRIAEDGTHRVRVELRRR